MFEVMEFLVIWIWLLYFIYVLRKFILCFININNFYKLEFLEIKLDY